MYKHMKKIILLPLLLSTVGCSYIYGEKGVIHNRNTDYLKAQSTPPLRIPPGLSSSTIESHYPVSYGDYPGSTTPVSLIPPELAPPAKKVTPVAQPVPVEQTTNTTQAKPCTKRKLPSYYYDQHTRSSFGQDRAQDTTCVSESNAQPVSQPAAVTPEEPTQLAAANTTAKPKRTMPNTYFDRHTRSQWGANGS